MHVALVSESFDPTRGGAERCAIAIGEALEARGHEVERIGRDPRRGRISGALALAGRASRERESADVVVSLCRAPGDVLYPQEGVHLAAVRGALARHGPLLGAALATLKLLSPRQWAFLATEGGGPTAVPGSRLARRLLGRASERPPRVFIALSRRIREDMIVQWGAPAEAIEVVPNGVDLKRFAPPSRAERESARTRFGCGEDELVLAFVSHNFALRGLDSLVRAAALAGGRTRILVAGRGSERGPGRLARALEVPLAFCGELQDVRPALAAADAFALPTYYDACSLSTLEALGAGLPVLTTRQNGAAELFSGEEAFVVESARSLGEIAAAIVRLRDPARRADMGAAARVTALRHPQERALGRVAEIIEGARR